MKRKSRGLPCWLTLPVLTTVLATLPCMAVDINDLPDGEGKLVFIALCTTCHELEEVTKFNGYYNEEQWHEVVLIMATYGVPISDGQIPVLVKYLTESFGPKDRK